MRKPLGTYTVHRYCSEATLTAGDEFEELLGELAEGAFVQTKVRHSYPCIIRLLSSWLTSPWWVALALVSNAWAI